MSSILLLGDTSGSITVAAPAVAGSGTLTLPTGTATLNTQGPVFSAYAVGSVSMTGGSLTKITFDTKLFDTATNYSTSTSRFTPTVAGYYRISAQVTGQATTTGVCFASIYVAGTEYKRGTYTSYSGTGTKFGVEGLVYCNGSTDYVEIYALAATTMGTYTASSVFTWFDGSFIRGA